MLTLQSGESSLVLAPEAGGAIVGWTFGRFPLLRRPDPDAVVSGNVRGLGCFPLVPFSNRIAHGRFRWDGADHCLTRNLGDHPHTIHGVGWQRAWEVASVTATSAMLTLRHDAAGPQRASWPFAFAAEQHFTLERNALHVALSLINLHTGPAPAGLGLHPYFPCANAPILRFGATGVWLNAANMLPSRCIAVPAEWDHAAGRPIGSAALDNCFTGWDRRATIVWASEGPGLAIEADGMFRHLVVYSPPRHDFFCVEPVSHMTDAVNRMDGAFHHGCRTLAKGEKLQGKVTFRLTTKG